MRGIWNQYHGVCVCAVIMAVLPLTGCAASRTHHKALTVDGGHLLNTNEQETMGDAVSALTAVTGAMSDKPLTDEQLYQAAQQMKDDPAAKTAVEAISSSFDKKNVVIKYSPATGKRYSADMEVDPETGVKLLILE